MAMTDERNGDRATAEKTTADKATATATATATADKPAAPAKAAPADRLTDKAIAERGKAVSAAILAIEKQFGTGSIMKLGAAARQQVDFIPTGSIALDLALGVGGIPRGRITEIFGPESSGKTTVCQHIIAEAQARGGVAAFIDVEHALDPGYARACGVNVDELLVSQPDTGEQALEITETLIRSGGIDVVVVDSVAALVPRAEIEGEMGDSFVGIQARLMSQALRKLTGAVSRSNTSLVFTNQLREKIGVMFGNPEVTPGGRALKFYASVRLDIRRVETIKTGTESVGNRVRVKVVKNKVAPPFRVAEFDVMYGEGVSKEGGLLDVGVAMGVVAKTGAWFQFDETRLGQGREAAKEFLKTAPDVSAEIDRRIRGKIDEVVLPVEGIEEAE
jgi:recombination protein RecA